MLLREAGWKYFISVTIFIFRYELREDRKRETARNTGQIDSIKRDIIRSLSGSQMLGPITPSSTSPPPTEPRNVRSVDDMTADDSRDRLAVSSLTLSTHDIEIIRKEVVLGVQNELKALLKEMQTQAVMGHQPPHMAPPHPQSGVRLHPSLPPAVPTVTSDLYQTHLFTQL